MTTSPNNEKHIPTIDEMIELPQISDVKISPDGTTIAYVVQRPDWKENYYQSQIWLVATDGKSKPRQLTFASDASSTSPKWSPDSQWLAFLSERYEDDRTQIYCISPFGGEAERLTESKTDIRALSWSPDGNAIAYTAAEPENEKKKKRKEKFGDYHVENEDYVYAHLWLLNVTDKKCRQITAGQGFHVTAFEWSPDNGRIALQVVDTPDMKDILTQRIQLLDVDSLELTPLTGEGCDSPCWSPDGSQIAFACTEKTGAFYTNNQVFTVNADGSNLKLLDTSFDADKLLMEWGKSGLYFTALQRTSIHVFCLDLDTGETRQITPTEPGWDGMMGSFTADFSLLAQAAGDASHIPEVVLVNTGDKSYQRLTHFNEDVANWQLSQSEIFQWQSLDGTPIEGVLKKPADFDPQKKYPLLVVIHGGPGWASFLSMVSRTGVRLYPIHQWAAEGALILQPNYRGSLGYGQTFRALNVNNLGIGDYEDVISGVQALIDEGWVDEERVGSMGWSQGGYISAFITTYSDQFKAVSVGAGISNWVTYYVNTDIHPFTRQYLESTPWENMEIYQKTSPMSYIQQAKTPTLIQHGSNDQRVPLPNAYELYQGLLDVGVETRLVVYPGMPHSPTKPRQSRQIMQDNWDWFGRFIWDKPVKAEKRPLYIALASTEQAENPKEIAAISRYTANHVQETYQKARRDDALFKIWSGQYGLVDAATPLQPDSQPDLQPEAVPDIAAKLAADFGEQGIEEVVLHTGPAKKRPAAWIALGCLQLVAGIAGTAEEAWELNIKHVEIEDEKADKK